MGRLNMIIANMNNLVICTDMTGAVPETYIIELERPVDIEIPNLLGGESCSIKYLVEHENNIVRVIDKLNAFKIKFTVLLIEELSIIHNTIGE